MDGHWFWVWVGRDGIMFVSYCSVTTQDCSYRAIRYKLLPAIQVQTLNGLMETISLAVNDLTREHSRRCEGC